MQVEPASLDSQPGIGACVGVIYGNLEAQPQIREFVDHMKSAGVPEFHMYFSRRPITFADNGEAWHHRPAESSVSPIEGVEWTHVDAFGESIR